MLILQISLQRRALTASERRDASIDDNMARFKEMCSGSTEGRKWSLRAKIDYAHKNGTMRDPVIYRSVDATHHITGCVNVSTDDGGN